MDAYSASQKINLKCKEKIETEIRSGYNGYSLDENAVLNTVKEFGAERTAYVIANTINLLPWDGRFSQTNREWAKWYQLKDDMDHGFNRRNDFRLDVHSGVLDVFTYLFRRIYD